MCNCKYFYFLSVGGNEEDAAALRASCRSAVSPWCCLLWQDRLAWMTGCPTKHRFASCSREVRLRKVSCIHIGILFLQARFVRWGTDDRPSKDISKVCLGKPMSLIGESYYRRWVGVREREGNNSQPTPRCRAAHTAGSLEHAEAAPCGPLQVAQLVWASSRHHCASLFLLCSSAGLCFSRLFAWSLLCPDSSACLRLTHGIVLTAMCI